ncbi:hypothetical protein NC796_08010 [Aliifodinibius sp. S!AR15-10]|uniref:hypothetical protein n=1 Tax=Aliifodinibius sp. S!AR15-10 TaxID=2950437 RepID=UPI00285A6F48|nr:hypothetical protein [Aliifodinibius sp. S!AR15-10]MDR8391077.1 hypothetical protein [Aliifodinibius sp. S!AR15-10]
MKKLVFAILLSLFILPETVFGQAQETKLVVRAKAQDAKFIGSSMGGAFVVVKNTETGEILAKGKTIGSTGDTQQIMNTPKTRDLQLSTPGAAKFETTLQLDEPTFVTIEVTAPYAQAQSHVTSSTQLWMIPGKDITGDGVLLEIPGFAVDVLSPQAHEVTSLKKISIEANLVMMCGCPTSPGGMWNSDEYEIRALIAKEGHQVASVPLTFAGKTSTFEGDFTPKESGAYQITVYAYHPETGNTGVDKTTVIFSGE